MKSKKLIRLSKSCLNDSEKKAVLGVLDRELLGMGDEVKIFENNLTNFFNRPAVCIVNGTAALQLALEACDISSGDQVLVPSITYVASFQAVTATGAKVVACDINPNTGFIDLKDAEKRLTQNTKAIMPVHYNGGVGKLDELYSFSKKNNLRVIEDAAHAFGTKFKNKRIGSFGDIACFSFDGIKNITSGEGGCVVTSDKKVLERIKDSRLLGVEKDSDKRYSGKRSWEFDVKRQGWRYHMSNIMAAIGIEQLKKFDFFTEKRQKFAKHYDEFFNENKRIKILKRDYNNVVPHIYVVIIENLKNRDLLRKKMLEKGIQTGIHYAPNHLLTFFKGKKSQNILNAEIMYKKILTLPLHPDLAENDINYVAKNLINFLNDNEH